MRVLMVHSEYRSIGGETLSVSAEYAALQADSRVSARLLTYEPLSFKTKPISTLRTVTESTRGRDRLSAEIDDFCPDIIHLQNIWPSLAGGAIEAIASRGIPYIQSVRNYRWSCLSANHFRDGKPCFACADATTAWTGLRLGCYRSSSAASAVVLLHARQLHPAYRAAPPARLVVLSNAMMSQLDSMDAYNLCPKVVKYNSLDHDPAPGQGGTRAVFVGRLADEKGVRLILEAWEGRTNVPLHIIGDGPLAANVADACKRNPLITWSPRLEQREVLDALATAKFSLCLPSWEEPFGRVALESLAVGTPVLHSGKGALPELVDSCGVRVDADSPSSVASGIDFMAESAHEMRLRARERYEEHFSTAEAARRLYEVYESVLS